MITDFLRNEVGLSTDASAIGNKAILFIAVLIVTWLVRRIVTSVLPGVVSRITRRTTTTIDDQFAKALTPPLRLLITTWGLGLALATLELPTDASRVIGYVIDSLIAFSIFWALFRLADPIAALIAHLTETSEQTPDVPQVVTEKLSQVGKQIAKGLIVVLGLAAILSAWNLDINGLIAGLGLAGAAVALAVKDTLANLLGYFVILADEPFEPGEYIVFDGFSGTVEHIGFRSTRIRALDQSLVMVPNNTLMNANIVNWSRLSKRRLNMTLGIEYGNAPDKVLSVVQAIREMLQAHDLVDEDSVVVQFTDFNDSSLDIIVICFMKIAAWGDFQAAKQDINFKIMDLLEERGVGIAFPTRTVVVEQAAAPEAELAPASAPPKPEPKVGTATDSPVPDDAGN